MNTKSQNYLNQMRQMYKDISDSDSLALLAQADEMDERVRLLKIYREQPKTQEIIQMCLVQYKKASSILTDSTQAMKLTDVERGYYYAMMEWAKITLSVVGEDPKMLEQQVDDLVSRYAEKAGIIHN